jgi:branched-chain amino acid aminotransferase
MFMADYKNNQWNNFKIEPYDLISFYPGSAVLHYAQSVFEGLKAYKSESGEILVFRPDMNFKRMNLSARRICIPEIPEDVFMGGLRELLKIDKNWVPGLHGTSLYIRPFAFALDEYIGIRPSDTYKFMIFTCPVGPYYSKPVKVMIETQFTRAMEGGTGFAKAAGNYAASLYPAKLAHEKGYDQLIWTDGKEHKYIEEAGTMNVMFLIGDKLVTSETGDSILSGITRDSVLTLARDWGMEVEERKISVDEIIDACKSGELKEAFGAGTAATIAHIDSIGFEGIDYQLRPVVEREFSQKVLRTLDDIRTGRIEDKFGWVYKL